MTTYADLAKTYANKLIKARNDSDLAKDFFIKEAAVKEAFNSGDSLLKALAEIDAELKRYGLLERDREFIVELTGENIGLDRPHDLVDLIKESSNKNALAVSATISQLISTIDAKPGK